MTPSGARVTRRAVLLGASASAALAACTAASAARPTITVYKSPT